MASGSIDPTTVELKPCVPAPIPNSSLRGSREGSVVGAGWAQRLIGLRTEPAKVLVPGGLAARLVALRGSNPAGKEAPKMAPGEAAEEESAEAIERLLRTFEAVVVLDVDIHHADGTESAFAHSAAVLNVSIHQHAPGFYPGTGALADRGRGRGLDGWT
jgi:hypothetical protein